MSIIRCVSGLGFGLLLASCAGQTDTSKYALSKPEASAPSVRFLRAGINPDGTVVDRAPRSPRKVYASKAIDRSQSGSTPTPTSQPRTDGPSATSEPLSTNTGLNSREANEVTNDALSIRGKPQFLTPVMGSDRWKKEEAENDKLDKQLSARLKGSICTKC